MKNYIKYTTPFVLFIYIIYCYLYDTFYDFSFSVIQEMVFFIMVVMLCCTIFIVDRNYVKNS
jgi:hypothetical protein